MTTPLLRTKLYIPPVRPGVVSRPHLIERLNAGLRSGRKLTLVSAPAGFGKTTLLGECVACCGRPAGWVSLDRDDNDPVRFWSYFIAALQTIHEGIGESVLARLQAPQLPPVEVLLTGLINEIAQIQNSLVLVLDDFHVIAEQQVHEGLTFLVDNQPSHMHLILSSRSDPPWPLARLRARRQITELRAKDLRFTPQEAAAFLNDAMSLGLSSQDVDALQARTEGWITGLQMAAISMQGRRQSQESRAMSNFIRAFTGSHRFVLDYLVEEVLDQQSPTIQEFLLKTCILEKLTASLCNAVTGRDDGQATLAYMDQANLFLTPLDDERRWYRYHQLFADLLRNRLQQTQPEQVPVLHRQASQWYEQHKLIAQAVSHALAADDLEQVMLLVEGHAFDMLDLRELTTLQGWLDILPEELLRSRPWLCIARAWLQVYTGRLDHVEPHLEHAKQALGVSTQFEMSKVEGHVLSKIEGRVLSEVEGQRITGHITAIRAYVAELQGDMPRAAELARQALKFLPGDDLKTRAFAAAMLGTVLHIQGELEAAAQAFAEAVTVSQKAGDSHTAVHALCDLAALQRDKGQLHQAAANCRQALDLADEYARLWGRRLPGVDYACARLSEILCQWNDLDAALRYAKEGVELAEQRREADKLWLCYTQLALVLSCRGDFDAALATLERARQTRSGASYHVAYTDLFEMALRLKYGDIATACRWVQETGASADDEIHIGLRYKYIVLARILIAQGQLDDALRLLDRLLKKTESAGLTGPVIRILIPRAMALQAQGKIEQALSALERALSLAAPGGYVRVFIDEGAPMGALLRQAASRGIAPDYVNKLLVALSAEGPESEPPPLHPRPPAPELIEPLSQRELDVLRLLPTSLTSTEIAKELLVAPSTVRTHIKRIYGKLDVHKRIAAVERARELGLL